MRLKGGIAAALLAIALAAVPAAEAASTRAEYVAQVDPICQSFATPLLTTFAAYRAAIKRTTRAAKSGNAKAFARGAKATASALNGISQIHSNLTDQIATVTPPAADAGAVSSWQNDLRQEGAFEAAAATALLRLKLKVFFNSLNQADAVQNAGVSAITGFGFHVCGVTVA